MSHVITRLNRLARDLTPTLLRAVGRALARPACPLAHVDLVITDHYLPMQVPVRVT